VETWNEVRAWRRAQRVALTERRLTIPRDERDALNRAVTARLEQALQALPGDRMIGFYWPFKGEYDPRALVRSLLKQGMRFALPVVVEKAQPLIFREWWPGMRMTPGIWDIPVPAEGNAVLPDTLLVPLLGFDEERYRLGYGGGYYDRTLAAMARRPLTIGVGFEMSRLTTIHPQSHDIPMDLIITGQQVVRSEPCL
jgi:5-formyltetrahydrofolate cyclo-ligase